MDSCHSSFPPGRPWSVSETPSGGVPAVTTLKEPSGAPLIVAVQGETILFLGLGEGPAVLTIRAAELFARRITDAIAVANGRLPIDAC